MYAKAAGKPQLATTTAAPWTRPMSRHTLRAIVFAAVPFVLASCSSSGENLGASAGGGRGERAGGRGAGAPVPVVTAQAVRKAVPVTIPAVGTVEAISSVEIRSQITGQVTAVHFTEGREVRQGQPLFSLDPRPFQTALQQARACHSNAQDRRGRAGAAGNAVPARAGLEGPVREPACQRDSARGHG